MLARAVRRTGRSLLQRSGYRLLRSAAAEDVDRLAAIGFKAQVLGMVPDADLRRALELLPLSQSQLNQDLFVLSQLGWKRDGFFVEFGATDGKTLNNTWLLERHFGWSGILAEPARVWHEKLLGAGRTAAIAFDCVWSRTGETLTFHETDWAELSTIAAFSEHDNHSRKGARSYQVQTITLNDLLQRHHAPAVMDYLSIDTEGSELEILGALDFASYRFRCITCEHNHTPNRAAIHDLLAAHGYRRVFAECSQYDDWYVSGD